jgi:hypothetical protein
MFSLDSPEVEDFLTKWFANGIFQFGQYRNKEAYNLEEYKKFILECKENKEPAFSSVSPRARIERIFWEFDFDSKVEGEKFTYKSTLLDPLWDEIMTLYLRIKEKGGKPLIVYSGNRGFHLWVYAFSTQIPEYSGEWEDTGEIFYKMLHKDILGDQKGYKYYDKAPTNVNSLARIPFSYHQKSGNQVIPLTPLRYPFMPKLEDFISCPLFPTYVSDVEVLACRKAAGKHEKLTRPPSKYNNEIKIRPCIWDAMIREPSHYARLAFVMDAIYAGIPDEDIHALMKSFKGTDDYNYSLTQYQIEYQREKIKEGMKPPTNETLIEWGILKELPKPSPNPWIKEKKKA